MSLKIRFWRNSFTNFRRSFKLELLLRRDSLFAFFFNLFPRNAQYSGYKLQENISSAKPTQAQSTCALHAAVTFVSRILYGHTWAQKTKRTCRSQSPHRLPTAKYYHYCLANISFFSPNTERNPLWISQLPNLRVKLQLGTWLTNFIMDTSFKIAYCSVASLSSMVFSLYGKRIHSNKLSLIKVFCHQRENPGPAQHHNE